MSPPDPPATPDDAVARLVELAREQTALDFPPESWAGLRRLERRVREMAVRPRVPPSIRYAVAIAGVLAAMTVAVLAWRDRALTFEVMNAAVGDGGYIAAGGSDAAVRFSDHSELGVEHGSHLRVSHLEARGAHVMLEGGLLHVRIRPRPRATWTLDAGPYVVHVTGTEFDLAWRANEQTLDLRLTKGSVTVDGPLAGGGLRMAAGQHLIANALDRSLSIVNAQTETTALAVEAAAARAVPAAPAGAPASPAFPSPSQPPAQRGQAASTRAEQGWATRVARGDFAGIVQDAERHGVDRTLAESSAGD
ncbi:MAG TPA: FecR domain-containing protein, partial [Polyangiaceae bacterium]|nr:FecR domain-containing protein [Polyangiaceae bacterium]